MADAVTRTPLAQSSAGNEEPSCSGIRFRRGLLLVIESEFEVVGEMKLIETFDHDRAAFSIGGGVGAAALVGVVQYFLALSFLQWLAFAGLLGLPIVAAAAYGFYCNQIRAKTREAEQASRLHLATVEALATAIDAKDQTTHCHVRRVQIYAAGLGRLFKLSEPELAALNAGALLHDIGKLAVPDHILNKPGALTTAEFERTKVHTVIGAEILGRVDFPFPVVPVVKHHHERWDGRGYPDGLKGELIPMTARIMSVVDCFDSVREDRPFRAGMTREQAIELLRKGSGTHFDPTVVERFIEHLPRFEMETA